MNPPPPNRNPNRSRARRWLAWGVLAAALAGFAPVLAAIVPSSLRPYRLDLLAHFAPHALAPIGALLLAAALLRARRTSLLIGGMLLCALVVVLAAYRPVSFPTTPPADAQPVRVVHFNARNVASSTDEEFIAWLLEQDADLISLVDAPPGLLQRSSALDARYPYRVTPERGVLWPIVLLSRHPLRAVSIGPTDKAARTSFVARRSVVVALPNGAEALFTALHPYSPRSQRAWRRSIETASRDGALLRLARDESGIPVIAAGDFNSTPTGRVFRTFARASGLRAGPVLPVGTWPTTRPRLLGVAIDHVFTSPDVLRVRRRVGPSFRSDHRPVVVDLAVPAPGQKSPPPSPGADSSPSLSD